MGTTSELGDCNVEVAEPKDDTDLKLYVNKREWLREFMHSQKFQISIIVLVILDCLLVIAELLLDIKILELHEESHVAPHVLHYFSIGILSIFIVEITVKVYAFGLEFFRHKLEVFDAFVVFLSFALDVSFREEDSVKNGFGLVIIMRLWRVARILNGVVISVKTQSEHKILKERKLREEIEQELFQCKEHIGTLEGEIAQLRQCLIMRGITLPTENTPSTPKVNSISVVAEVNSSPP